MGTDPLRQKCLDNGTHDPKWEDWYRSTSTKRRDGRYDVVYVRLKACSACNCVDDEQTKKVIEDSGAS